jgi:hypothetical protein
MSFTNIANPAHRAYKGEMSKESRIEAFQATANMALNAQTTSVNAQTTAENAQTTAENAHKKATAASSRADVAHDEARAALRMTRVSFTLLLLCVVITLLSADFGRTAAVAKAWWCTTVPGACLEPMIL